MQEYISSSTKETENIAEEFAKKIKNGDVIAYEGPMGMGKTAFTRGLCRGLGIDDSDVSSPTFALVHEYKGKDKTLYHFDMYRIDTME
ncbi:MAG: tRNA (adenosine(37)-N6)-threonylcarbamoyltransferase complex ATPase subunit type 1 TsaE, partial [Oscillospiraceae bacterium]